MGISISQGVQLAPKQVGERHDNLAQSTLEQFGQQYPGGPLSNVLPDVSTQGVGIDSAEVDLPTADP